MIFPYYGMFLGHPVPLELSLDSCNYACGYCFSSLNGYTRKASTKSIVNLIKERNDRDTLTARLLSEGYPVCLSNRTDPFCERNRDEAIQLIRLMCHEGIPLEFQTKGGDIGDILDYLPPSCWYITIEFDDDEKRKIVSPNAPDIESRWELVERLREKGHFVTLGLNPYNPKFILDEDTYLKRAKEYGVDTVLVSFLHLNYVQIERLNINFKNFLGYDELKKSGKKRTSKELFNIVDNIKFYGLNPYFNGIEVETNPFEKHRLVYKKTFPVLNDFIRFCHIEKLDKNFFDFETFYHIITRNSNFIEGFFNLESYIASKARQFFRTNKMEKKISFKQLLSIIWGYDRIPSCPFNFNIFNKVLDLNGETIKDKNNLELLTYREGGDIYDATYEEEGKYYKRG